MRGVVNRSVVEGDEVLVWRAATHAEARGAFRCGLYARQQLYRLDDVDFTHQSRDLPDSHHLEFLHAHGKLSHVGIFLLTRNHDIVEHL